MMSIQANPPSVLGGAETLCARRNPGGTVVGVVGVEPEHEHLDEERTG